MTAIPPRNLALRPIARSLGSLDSAGESAIRDNVNLLDTRHSVPRSP